MILIIMIGTINIMIRIIIIITFAQGCAEPIRGSLTAINHHHHHDVIYDH